jgi:hypothetical protein
LIQLDDSILRISGVIERPFKPRILLINGICRCEGKIPTVYSGGNNCSTWEKLFNATDSVNILTRYLVISRDPSISLPTSPQYELLRVCLRRHHSYPSPFRRSPAVSSSPIPRSAPRCRINVRWPTSIAPHAMLLIHSKGRLWW